MPKLPAPALLIAAVLIGQSVFAADGGKGPKTVTEQQAAAEAKANQKLANQLWAKNLKACKAQDKPQLQSLLPAPYKTLNAQPTNHLKYRARFAYEACRNMLSDVAALNGACQGKSTTEYGLARLEESWTKNSTECAQQIEHPDLSYDAPEPTEAELTQQLRKEGKSEEDIEFIRQLHQL